MPTRPSLPGKLAAASLLLLATACSGAAVSEDGRLSPSAGAGVVQDGEDGDDGEGGSSLITAGAGSNCGNAPSLDGDGDGVTGADGDCNDCDADVSPEAAEVAGTGSDENCNGLVDEPTVCDKNLELTDGDPRDAARAMGLCTTAATDGYGVVEAKWVRADGTPAEANAQVGILDGFGPNVPALQGSKVLALSSGHARLPSQPEACNGESCRFSMGTAPEGFPQDVPSCPGSGLISDDIGLELRLKAPANATGFRYRFRFYSFEFPEWVCSAFNDQFVALATPAPPGAINGNISFDGATNPVSVNIAFFNACDGCQPWAEDCLFEELVDSSVECPPEPSPCCPDGPEALAGTGFDQWAAQGAGGTSWLETQAPIEGGAEFTLRFAIWDTGDSDFDSTAILDDFEWLGVPGVFTGTGEVPN